MDANIRCRLLSTVSPSDDDNGGTPPPIDVTVTNSSDDQERSNNNTLNLTKGSDQLAEEEILELQSELRTHHRHAAYDTALETATKLLDLSIAQFGNLHPATASAFNNVGLMSKCLGKYTDAKEAYHEALRIYGEVCGKDHASYAAALSNLGMLERGRVLESESNSDNGDDNDDGSSSSSNLPNEDGTDLEELRDNNKTEGNEEKLSAMERMQLNESAIEYFDEAYRIRLSELGANHPHTITSQSQLGSAMAAAVLAERRGRIGGLIESELRLFKRSKNVKNAKEMEAYVPEAIARAASKTSLGGKGSKLTRRRWEAAEQHLRDALSSAVENPRGESVGALRYIPIGGGDNASATTATDDIKVEKVGGLRRGLTLPPKEKELSKKEKKRLNREKRSASKSTYALRGGTNGDSKDGQMPIQGVAGKIITLSASTAAQNLAVFLKHYSDWMRLSLMDESKQQSEAQAEPSQQQLQSTKLLDETITEARHLYEAALHVRSSVLPPHHPDCIATKFSLAELLDSPKVTAASILTDLTLETKAEAVDSARANQLREEILSAYNVEERLSN